MGEWMQLAVKEWRVRFTVAGREVRVHEIYSGFQAAQLASSNDDATRIRIANSTRAGRADQLVQTSSAGAGRPRWPGPMEPAAVSAAPWLLLLLLLLLLQLLLLFPRHVMPDSTSCRGTQHRMMPGDVPRHGTHRRSLEATLRNGSLTATEEGDSKHGYRKRLYF